MTIMYIPIYLVKLIHCIVDIPAKHEIADVHSWLHLLQIVLAHFQSNNRIIISLFICNSVLLCYHAILKRIIMIMMLMMMFFNIKSTFSLAFLFELFCCFFVSFIVEIQTNMLLLFYL